MIEFGHSTHVGLRREHNEDTYYADADLGLWLVADGMGGHEHGEVASALARDTLVSEVGKGAELVRAMDRSPSEIYRMLERLVARGYVARVEGGDRYALSMKLFLLAHRHLGLDHRRVGEYGRHGRSPGLHG